MQLACQLSRGETLAASDLAATEVEQAALAEHALDEFLNADQSPQQMTPLVIPDGGPAESCRDYPQCVAAENSTRAFTELVERFVAGRIPRQIPGIDEHARRLYSEKAVKPSILEFAERIGAFRSS